MKYDIIIILSTPVMLSNISVRCLIQMVSITLIGVLLKLTLYAVLSTFTEFIAGL